ncbi:MAG: hypothetical protein ISS57_19835 [Anaerolineales bacterium]|nr:hypothetical protein [Anaerolineales bacterium]
MKQTQVFVSLVMMVSFLITSCKAESIEPTPHIVGTAAAMAETIVAVQLTNIDEAVTETSTPTPKPTFTATPSLTFALPTLFPTQQANSGQSETETCLLAHMISETIPDNTEVEQGEFFEKTWVLQNTGSCTWTEQYSIVFSHGTRMGAPERVNFPGSVAPGESFTLKIPMIAPALAGEQTSFWYLESADGQHFGTRTSGVFWVRLGISRKIIIPKG